MKITLGHILKHLSLWAIMLSMAPAVLIIMRIFEIAPSVQELIYTSSFVVIMGYLGYCHAFCDSKVAKNEKYSKMIRFVLRALIYLVTFIVPICILFKMRSLNLVLGVAYLLLGTISYIMVSGYYDHSYGEILKGEMFVFILAIYIPSYLITGYQGFVIGFIAIVLLYLMVQNQSELESMLERTQKNTPMIGQVRRTNVKWMMIIYLGIVILYPLRHILVNGMQSIVQGIVYGLAWFILTFMQSEESEVVQEDLPANEGDFMMTEDGSSWLGNLLTFGLIVAIIVVCIVKREEILYGIRVILSHIGDILKSVFNKLFGERSYKDVNAVYYDEVVEKMTEGAIEFPQTKKHLSKWAFRKQLKAFTKEEDQEKKYRMGYKLLLEGQRLKGFKQKESHTPREIANVIEEDYKMQQIHPITETYERVRYGEISVKGGEIERLEETLRNLI